MQINISKNTKAGTAIMQLLQFYKFQLYTFQVKYICKYRKKYFPLF